MPVEGADRGWAVREGVQQNYESADIKECPQLTIDQERGPSTAVLGHECQGFTGLAKLVTTRSLRACPNKAIAVGKFNRVLAPRIEVADRSGPQSLRGPTTRHRVT